MNRPAWVILSLLTILWIGPTDPTLAQAGNDGHLTVVTYNIRYANPKDGANVWENRREAMVSYLRRTGADLIGLQEVEPAQRAYLAEQLTDYAWYGVGRNAVHDEGEGTPIFYRRDRFDPIDRGTFWLSPTPDVAGSRGWDAALPRVASWMTLRDRRTGHAFLMVNTHFDHMGSEARLQSATLMTRKIDELARAGNARHPVILTGDFNCRPDSAPYAAIANPADAALALVDAQHVSRTPHTGGNSTSNAFTVISPGAKIDHVFVRDVPAVLAHRIEDPRVDGRFVSDHQPIVAVLDLREGR
jgi:endonuclease/exonuclease/phosphatase family metal-dependent hydrolase